MTEYEIIDVLNTSLSELSNDNERLFILNWFREILINDKIKIKGKMEKILGNNDSELKNITNEIIHQYREDILDWILAKIDLLEAKNRLKKIPSQNREKESKKFQFGELKKECKIIAEELGLKKGETLMQVQIDEAVSILESKGFKVNKKSVGTVLRDKLGYRKRTKQN